MLVEFDEGVLSGKFGLDEGVEVLKCGGVEDEGWW